jgi:hypothetical protein
MTSGNANDPLQRSVFDVQTDSEALKRALVSNIWGYDHQLILAQFDVFLQHYSLIVRTTLPAPLGGPREVVHWDIVKLVQFVRDNKNESLGSLCRGLEQHQQLSIAAFSDSARMAVELAVRIWLMIDPSRWQDDVSLIDFIRVRFPRCQSQPVGGSLMPLRFNTYRLNHDGDFDIAWTDDLSRHLDFDERSRRLVVFRQAAFLRNYQNEVER